MNNKKRNIISISLVISALLLLNFLASFVFHRFDLTTEKRYTLSPVTKSLLNKLDAVVSVKVYMGKNEEFPAGFKHLRNETREMLNEFKAYSNNHIKYEFINPSENPNKKEKDLLFKELYEKGLQPTNLEVKEESGLTQKIIWPAALVSYNGKEVPWQLLKTQLGQSPERQLNNSIQALEYEFASCIRNLSIVERPQIGFVRGHGELDPLSVDDISNSLSEFYTIKQIIINEQLNALDSLKAIIIAKPDTSFSEIDKFVIDQYIMKGGKVIWVIDPLNTSVDSLRVRGGTVATAYDLNLENSFFKYGVRLNSNLIVDLQSGAIPVNKAFVGQEPRFELMPWLFSPLVLPKTDHPIVKNLEMIKMDFASSIDTIAAKGIKKTILLKTSKYARTLPAPVRIDLRMVNMKPDESQFNNPYQNLAVLLEGEFESVFKNRVKPDFMNTNVPEIMEDGVSTQMIVIGDGDVIRNEVQFSSNKPYPLGYDKYTNQTYGNKTFILNCVNYLCDDSGLISVRSRELTMRLLDKTKVQDNQLKWQMINVLLPLVLILLFGIAHHLFRKRKYSS